MKYIEFKQKLYSMKDEKFQEFSSSLSGSNLLLIGVRIPLIKEFVKKEKDDYELKLSDFELTESIELTLSYFLLSLLRLKTNEEQLVFLDNNLQYANGWIITDCLPQYLKKLTFKEYYPYFINFSSSKETYKRRASYVIAMKFYKNQDSLSFLNFIKTDSEYYVMMAQAWFLATMAIFHHNDVYQTLLRKDLDLTLKLKTISKISDSYRITNENKEKYKQLRNILKNELL